MASYQSFLSIQIKHEYYNSHQDELAPFDIVPSQQTKSLLKQYSMLLKPKLGFIQLIVDSEIFSDLAELTQTFELQFYLVSADAALRSITDMPNEFDISNISAEFTKNTTLNINAGNWIGRKISNVSIEDRDSETHNSNLIAILNVHIPKSLFTLEKKHITLSFKTISTYWKYYFLSLKSQSNLNIIFSSNELISFSEQTDEKIQDKTAKIFLSNKQIPLKKAYAGSYSLYNNKKIIYKALPLANKNNISIQVINGEKHLTSHIYVS
jgi:hypothetical protein